MSDAEKNNKDQNGLDISEYIPGYDLKNKSATDGKGTPLSWDDWPDDVPARKDKTAHPFNLVLNIVIGFVLAFLINLIVPIPKVSTGFAGLFGIRPHTLAENLVGGIPVCLIFTAGISFPMTAFNLFLASRKTPELTFSFQVVSGSFLRTFLPLFGIMYVVSFIMIPVAATCANKACRR